MSHHRYDVFPLFSRPAIVILCLLSFSPPAPAQVEITGRLWAPIFPGSETMQPFTTITGFANRTGPDGQALTCRTWETEPAGWYFFSGVPGNYTIVLSNPSHFMRPVLRTNLFTRNGDIVVKNLAPRFDYALFDDSAWDPEPAAGYYQTFQASGMSITHIGFKLAHDGVDGEGPGSQNLLVSIHRVGDGPSETWEQVGPTGFVPNVNCGGGLNRSWSAGWNSGEIPTAPGEHYAVHLFPESATGTFQAFWSDRADVEGDCFRIASDGSIEPGKDLWMAVGSDNDGLVIPYNKRVHQEFGDLTDFGTAWSQTWVARGRGLAGVILTAAVPMDHPWLIRQRFGIRIRRGGPEGPAVGIEKIAKGQSTAHGFAGAVGVAFAPGEIPLEPGETYAVEWRSAENAFTMANAAPSGETGVPATSGLNPYGKVSPDTYDAGTGWYLGEQRTEFDLDMQVIEYENAGAGWEAAVAEENLLTNGDMETGAIDTADPDRGTAAAWTEFTVDPDTTHQYVVNGESGNRFLRIIGGGANERTVNGGYVQAVSGLSPSEAYRLSGLVRSTWAVDSRHRCSIGWDPTGQVENPEAESVVWTILPDFHGEFVPYSSDPIRPHEDSVSVWLQAWTNLDRDHPFMVDFDDFALRRVLTSAPNK
jgi:hypothetical protein